MSYEIFIFTIVFFLFSASYIQYRLYNYVKYFNVSSITLLLEIIFIQNFILFIIHFFREEYK